jgi:enoyl-[acyl-carrier protein] reductase I
MLEINLKGKIAFVAGIGDDQGFGWAIAKALAEAGATLLVGTWTPILKIFTTSLNAGKFDASRRLSDGSLMEFTKIYPLDASFDRPEDVPEEVRENKRYKDVGDYTISEVAAAIERDFGKIDILIHSLANAPEVQNPLLATSRKGYLAAISSSAYSFVSLTSHFGPLMNPLGLALSLTYIASEKVIPGYGGGMSSAKAALESDTRTLAWEAGRKWNIRVNTISAGPLGSRAAKAIGFIDRMIDYSEENAPLSQKRLQASEIGNVAAFLASPLASAVTGTIIYVDNGLHAMGVAVDSPCLQAKEYA